MTARFPVGAMVDLRLELHGMQAQIRGEVRVSNPFLGIGIAFREMTDENRVRLQEMARSLLPSSRTAVAKSAGGVGRFSDGPLPVIVNPAAALQSVVEFFEEHPAMSKDEFLQTIRKSQSSIE